MRILYVAFKHDYGHVERGLSFEHFNFYESLRDMGHEIDYFDIGAQLRRLGREGMNALLRTRAAARQHDLMFTCMMGDELDPEVVSDITSSGDTLTFNWFCDDHWRFDSFTRRWAPCFSWVSTTAASALPKYASLGYHNVVKTQWAAADSVYYPRGFPLVHDVTFVGQRYGDRPEVVRSLRRAGLHVDVWGTGWGVRPWHKAASRAPVLGSRAGRRWRDRAAAATRCSQDEMLRIFEQSRINVDLVAASQGSEAQIKGRTFEVPACRGFLLDGPAQGIEEYFDVGRELVLYDELDDLVDKARYFLRHDSEREAIRDAGFRRVQAEHTYRMRFRAIFSAIGLS